MRTILPRAAFVAALAGSAQAQAQECTTLCKANWWKTASAEEIAAELSQADPNARNASDMTPLFFAVHGSAGGVSALLEAGADPNARNRAGSTPMHVAAKFGSPESVSALLEAGADVNARSKNGATPLHGAAESGSPATIAALLEAGADPDAKDSYGIAPLHAAVLTYSPTGVSALLEGGADPDAVFEPGALAFAGYEPGGAALHLAIAIATPKRTDTVREMLAALLDAGADGSLKDTAGNTPVALVRQRENLTGNEVSFRLFRDFSEEGGGW